MRAIPGHGEYVLYPYERDLAASIKRCKEMGRRCNLNVDIEVTDAESFRPFWECLKEHTGGIPGQKDSWQGPNQWTIGFNEFDDCVGIHVGNPERFWVYVRAGDSQKSEVRTSRMQSYSLMIQDVMGDQILGDDIQKRSEAGRSITVEKHWTYENEEDWLEASVWIQEQVARLKVILDS